jgi:hypothetical protein
MKIFLIISLISSILAYRQIFANRNDRPLPSHIYIEEGVEYVDIDKRNDTMLLVLK